MQNIVILYQNDLKIYKKKIHIPHQSQLCNLSTAINIYYADTLNNNN